MSDSVLTLTLVRHGETEWNACGRYQGHCNAPLNAKGVAQAEALRSRLDALRAHHPLVFSSDLLRARQTADIAAPWAQVRVDARLRELAFGDYEGRTYDDNVRQFGTAFEQWVSDPSGGRPPHGETLQELQRRVTHWLAELPRSSHVIAFTHGGVVRVLRAHARGEECDFETRIPNGSIVELQLATGRFVA